MVIQAHKLSKRYGAATVVDEISFGVPRGECCGILGPNGAGKTTTLKLLIGNIPFATGELTVLGYRIPAAARAMRARIGVVPQADILDPDFSVVENLLVYGGYFGFSRKQLNARIPRLLELAVLEDKANLRIGQLSGGMKRRLSIVRALINDPELIILDEPTTGLDPQMRQNIWQLLRDLQKSGMTIVLTTHYMDEAERLCDRIILMDKGRILADTSPEKLIREQCEPQVLEVWGAGLAHWRESLPVSADFRCEQVGQSCFFYGKELQRLIPSIEQLDDLRYLYRPANLEDVFLRLTGRELRDG